MLKYYYDNPEVKVPYHVLVADEQVRAACLKDLHPNYVKLIGQLPLIAALSSVVWGRSSAFLTFLRNHFSLFDRHYPALRSPPPLCVDGLLIDGAINFLRGALALGNVEGRLRPVVFAGENIINVLCSLSADGVGLAPDAKYDPYSQTIQGLKGATTDIIKGYFEKDSTGKYHITAASSLKLLEKHGPNEDATTYMLMLVNGTLSAPVYLYYGDKTGGQEEAKRRYDNVVAACSKCLQCLTTDSACDGHETVACTMCTSAGVTCVKARILTFSTDRAAGALCCRVKTLELVFFPDISFCY